MQIFIVCVPNENCTIICNGKEGKYACNKNISCNVNCIDTPYANTYSCPNLVEGFCVYQ